MKLNKKVTAMALVALVVGGQVFASTELTATFRQQFKEWTAKRIEIRKGTTEREILKATDDKTAQAVLTVAAEKKAILEELNALLEEQLKQGKDIEALLADYQAALADEKVIQLAQVDEEFAAFLEEMNVKVEELVAEFDANTIAVAKDEIIKDKEAKIEEIKTAIKETTEVSKEELAAQIVISKKELTNAMKTARENVREEVLAYFDSEMESLIASLPVLKEECKKEMIEETEKAVEAGKNELIEVANTISES